MDVPVTLSAVVPLVRIPTVNPVADFFGNPDVMGFLKTSGIYTGIAGILFVMIKFQLVQVISIEPETVAIRQSWGRVKYYNPRTARLVDWLSRNSVLATPLMSFAMNHSPRLCTRLARAGRLVVLHPGPHEVFRGMHNLIVISLREIVLNMPKETMTYKGRTLHYKMTPTLQVAYDGTVWGEQNLLKSVFSVRDTNFHDGDIGVLRDKLTAIFEAAATRIQAVATPDKNSFPKLKTKQFRQEAGAQILDLHGYRMRKLHTAPMSWTEAQIIRDGRVEAARIEADAKIQAATLLAKAIAEQEVLNPGPRAVAGVAELTDTA